MCDGRRRGNVDAVVVALEQSGTARRFVTMIR